MGRFFITIGLLFLALGLILAWAPWLLGWFGKLPGDIDYQSSGTRIFIPLTSMIVISIIVTIIINLFLHR